MELEVEMNLNGIFNGTFVTMIVTFFERTNDIIRNNWKISGSRNLPLSSPKRMVRHFQPFQRVNPKSHLGVYAHEIFIYGLKFFRDDYFS